MEEVGKGCNGWKLRRSTTKSNSTESRDTLSYFISKSYTKPVDFNNFNLIVKFVSKF